MQGGVLVVAKVGESQVCFRPAKGSQWNSHENNFGLGGGTLV